MSEEEKVEELSGESDGLVAEGESPPPALSRQLPALLTLVLVLGALWLVLQYLPTAGEWLGNATKEMVSTEEKNERGAEEVPEGKTIAKAPETSGKDPTVGGEPTREQPDRRQYYISQIVEQLGGNSAVEVRHLTLSEDESKMVAALRLSEENGESRLLELYFERDDFGRYLSTEDSPLDVPVTVWPD